MPRFFRTLSGLMPVLAREGGLLSATGSPFFRVPRAKYKKRRRESRRDEPSPEPGTIVSTLAATPQSCDAR